MGFDTGAFIAGLTGGFAQTSSRMIMEGEKRRYDATASLVENIIKQGDVDAYAGLTPSIKQMFGSNFVEAGLLATKRNQQLLALGEKFRQDAIGNIFEAGQSVSMEGAPGPRSALGAGGPVRASDIIEQTVQAGTPGASAPAGLLPGVAGGAEPPVVTPGGGIPTTFDQRLQSAREGQYPIPETQPTAAVSAPETVAPPPSDVGVMPTTQAPQAAPPQQFAQAPATTAIPGQADVPTPRQEARPAASVPQPPDDAEASKWLSTKFAQVKGGVRPGMSVNMPLPGGGSVTINGTDTNAEKARKVMAAGSKIGATPAAVGEALTNLGLPVSEEALRVYGERQALGLHRQLVPAMAQELGSDEQDPAVQRAAAYEVFKRTGYLSPRLEKITFATPEDREREVTRLVQRQAAEGKPVREIIRDAKTNGLGLKPDVEKGLLQQQMGQVFQAAVAGGANRNEALQVAFGSVNYDPAAIKDFAASVEKAFPAAETGTRFQRELAKEGPQAQQFPTSRQITQAQTRTDIGEAAQAGLEASARTTGQRRAELATPERMPNTQQEALTKVRNTLTAAKTVADTFDPDAFGLGQETLGSVVEKLGGKTPQESAFRAAVNRLRNTVITSEAGLSQTTTEVANQRTVVPLLDQPARVAIPRLMALVEDQRGRALNILKNAQEQVYQAAKPEEFQGDFMNQMRARRFQQLLPRLGGDKQRVYQQMQEEGF